MTSARRMTCHMTCMTPRQPGTCSHLYPFSCFVISKLESKQKQLVRLDDQLAKLEVQATDKVRALKNCYKKIFFHVIIFFSSYTTLAREQGDCLGHFQTQLPGPAHLGGLVQEVGGAYREGIQQNSTTEVCVGH